MTDSKKGELTGQTLSGYHIMDRLGSGGMSTVYKAMQSSINRTVAIKVMPAHLLNDPTFLRRFQQEVEVIAALQHPRVMPVYDYGKLGERPYIVMAHIDGGTLTDLIKRGPMDTTAVMRVIQQVAEGLTHAHEHGVIHRDFKPSNVLLDKGGNCYLADFGIAKLTEDQGNLTGSGIIGTPAYMAPEMAQEGTISAAVDIYAVGVTLFEMLAGKYPFEADTAIRLIMAHVSSPVPDITEYRPELPHTVSDVIAKAMAKRPEDRYDTAIELATDLRKAFAGQPVNAPPRPVQVEDGVTTALDLDMVGGSLSDSQRSTPLETLPPNQLDEPTPIKERVEAIPAPPPAKKRNGPPLFVIIGLVILGFIVCSVIGLVMTGSLGGNGSDTPVAAPTSTLAEGMAAINITNNSNQALCGVYIAVGSSTAWSTNQIPSREIEAGGSYRLTGLEAGTYNLRVDTCDDQLFATSFNALLDGNINWVVREGAVNVINETDVSYCELYFNPVALSDWNQNILKNGDQINPGDEIEYPLGYGDWNLRAVPCEGGNARTLDGVSISGPSNWRLQQ